MTSNWPEPPDSKVSVPPPETLTPNAEPPDETTVLPPLLTRGPMASPPLSTVCNPPDNTLVRLAKPKTSWTPPLLTVAMLSEPLAAMISLPPLAVCAPWAPAPDNTVMRPPDWIRVRLAAPCTICEPPAPTDTEIVKPP